MRCVQEMQLCSNVAGVPCCVTLTCARHLPVGLKRVTPRNGEDLGMAAPSAALGPAQSQRVVDLLHLPTVQATKA